MAARENETLTEQFWAATRQLRHLSRETLRPWDIHPSHARALGVLLHHGPMRSGELSRHLRIAARSATEVVDELAERDLVERRPDPVDRRATVVAPTARGTELGEAIGAARKAEADRYFGTLSRTDQTHLARILRKLAEYAPGTDPVSRRPGDRADPGG